MAINLSRTSTLFRAANSAPSVALPHLSPIVIRSDRKVVQPCSGKLRSATLKSALLCRAIVGQAAEEIKEDDPPSASPKNHQVNLFVLMEEDMKIYILC